MVRTRITTGRQIKPPKRFAEYLSGNSLDQMFNEQPQPESRKTLNRVPTPQQGQKRGRGRPRKSQIMTNPPEPVEETLTLIPNKNLVSQNKKVPLMGLKSTKRNQGIELQGELLNDLNNWTRLLESTLTKMGTKSSPIMNQMTLQATLQPGIITELNNVIFKTQLIGVKNQNGEIVVPREFQLGFLKAASPNQSLEQSPRIQEISEEMSGEMPENLSENLEFSLPMMNQASNQFSNLNLSSTNSRTQNIDVENTENLQAADELPQYAQQSPSSPLNRQRRELITPKNNMTRTLSPISGDRGMPADLFYNLKQPSGYSGLDLAKFKRYNNVISRHKPFKSKFKRNPVVAPGLYTFLFADTIHAYKDTRKNKPSLLNGGYEYILVVVDALSRQSFVRPLFTSSARECAAAFEDICLYLDLPGSPFLVTDRGPEFSAEFDKIIRKWGFQRIRLQGRHKAMIAERFM